MRSATVATAFLIVAISFVACKSDPVIPKHAEGPSYLGILYVDGPDGIRIVEVFPNSPAHRAGLEIGDMIQTANGRLLGGGLTLRYLIRDSLPGSEMHLGVQKFNGTEKVIKAILEAAPPGLVLQ